jgi:hypothetical protein
MARFRLGLRVRQDWGALPRPSIGRQYTPMVQSESAAGMEVVWRPADNAGGDWCVPQQRARQHQEHGGVAVRLA